MHAIHRCSMESKGGTIINRKQCSSFGEIPCGELWVKATSNCCQNEKYLLSTIKALKKIRIKNPTKFSRIGSLKVWQKMSHKTTRLSQTKPWKNKKKMIHNTNLSKVSKEWTARCCKSVWKFIKEQLTYILHIERNLLHIFKHKNGTLL